MARNGGPCRGSLRARDEVPRGRRRGCRRAGRWQPALLPQRGGRRAACWATGAHYDGKRAGGLAAEASRAAICRARLLRSQWRGGRRRTVDEATGARCDGACARGSAAVASQAADSCKPCCLPHGGWRQPRGAPQSVSPPGRSRKMQAGGSQRQTAPVSSGASGAAGGGDTLHPSPSEPGRSSGTIAADVITVETPQYAPVVATIRARRGNKRASRGNNTRQAWQQAFRRLGSSPGSAAREAASLQTQLQVVEARALHRDDRGRRDHCRNATIRASRGNNTRQAWQ